MEVVCEDSSKPLSVAGLTADETFSELPEELGEGASMKVTPLADEKQKQKDQYYSVPPTTNSHTRNHSKKELL